MKDGTNIDESIFNFRYTTSQLRIATNLTSNATNLKVEGPARARHPHFEWASPLLLI